MSAPTLDRSGAPTRQSRNPSSQKPSSQGIGAIIALLGALTALAPLTIDLYLPALPDVVADFSSTNAGVQATLTGALIGVGIGQLVLGPLSDSYGRRRPLLIAVLAYVVASVGAALAPTLSLFFLARVGQGFTAAAGGVIALAVIRDLYTGLRGVRALSRLMLVVGVAPVLAPSLGSLLLSITEWRGVFWVLAAVGVTLAVVGSIGLKETLPVERRRPAGLGATLRTYRSLLRDRTLVGLILTGGLVMAQVFAYVSGSSFVFQEQYGLSTLQFGLLFGVNSVGLFTATQVNATLVRRFDPQDILTVALSTAAAAGVVGVVTAATGLFGLVGLVVPVFLMMVSVGFAMPNVPGLALAGHGDAAGSTAALLGGANFAIGAAVAPVVGVLGLLPGTSMAVVIAATSVLGLAAYLFVARPSRLPAFDRTDPVDA